MRLSHPLTLELQVVVGAKNQTSLLAGSNLLTAGPFPQLPVFVFRDKNSLMEGNPDWLQTHGHLPVSAPLVLGFASMILDARFRV